MGAEGTPEKISQEPRPTGRGETFEEEAHFGGHESGVRPLREDSFVNGQKQPCFRPLPGRVVMNSQGAPETLFQGPCPETSGEGAFFPPFRIPVKAGKEGGGDPKTRPRGRDGRETGISRVPSVWNSLLQAEAEGSLVLHPSRHTVLVFNRLHGPEFWKGIRAFAIHSEVFEYAALWAMQTPVAGKDYDIEKFLISLSPSMPLVEGKWKDDLELLRYSIEISNELMTLFGIDSNSVWRRLTARPASRISGEWDILHGGMLLDLVLERVREKLEQGFSPEGAPRQMREDSCLPRGIEREEKDGSPEYHDE